MNGMWRRGLVLLVFAGLVACDREDRTQVKETARAAKDKVDKALDKLDVDEVKERLAKVRDALAQGLDTAVDCAWAAQIASDVIEGAAKDPATELRNLCRFDAPLGRATRAVTRAEKARAEQPGAPTLTECSSEDWDKARAALEPDFGTAPRWVDLKARWAKVCAGS